MPSDPATAGRLARLEAELAQLRAMYGQLIPDPDARPWLKVTGKGTGSDADNYAWVEAAFDTDAAFYERPGGMFGTVNGVGGETVTSSPARETNGGTVGTFPHYAQAERAVVTTEGPVYYFSAGGGGGGLTYVETVTDTDTNTNTNSLTTNVSSSTLAAGEYLILGYCHGNWVTDFTDPVSQGTLVVTVSVSASTVGPEPTVGAYQPASGNGRILATLAHRVVLSGADTIDFQMFLNISISGTTNTCTNNFSAVIYRVG
jgi:hypothetical protein